jgi:hypothetical protein
VADGTSGFVAGMFGVATHGVLTESPLQLDAPASIVRIFLDAMFISGNPSIHTDPEEFNVLLALCERCQSPEVEDKLFDCLIRSPILKKYPFQFFVLAAKTDRPALAKSAAEVLQEDQDHSDILSWSADEVNEIGARYFMALLKACMEGRCGGLFIGSDVGRHLERFIQSSRRTEK